MERVGPQTIADVLRTIYVVVKKKSETDYVCLFMCAHPVFQNSVFCSENMVRPGLWRLRRPAVQLKSIILALRQLGYYVEVYDQQWMSDWYQALNALPVSVTNAHDNDLVALAKTLPACQTYVELFGSGTSLLSIRDPAPVEVYNDRSSHVVNFFRVLRSPDTFSWFFILSRLFPVSSRLSRKQVRTFIQSDRVDADAVLTAYAWYCNLRTPASLGVSDVPDCEDPIATVLSSIDPSFPWVRNRLMRVQYEHYDWEQVLSIYDTQGSLFWVDVPCRGREALTYEGIHTLISALNSASGAVVLYLDHSDKNETVENFFLAETRRNGSIWKAKRYPTCTVYQKPNK